MSLSIERVRTSSLAPRVLEQVQALCKDAYGEDLSRYFADIGPGVHLIGWHGPALVSHLHVGRSSAVCRWAGAAAVGLCRTGRNAHPRPQARVRDEVVCSGWRSRSRRTTSAPSPGPTTLYERLGWEKWRGPLSVRTGEGIMPTPDEEVLVLRLPGSPALDLDASLAVDWRPGEIW